MTEDKIQDYVMGNLPPDEASVVAKAIAADPGLARLADQHASILGGFQQERKNVLTEELMELENRLPAPGSKPSSFGGKWLWVFGIVILLLTTGFFYQRQHYSNSNLAERYFKIPLDPRIAGTTEDAQTYNIAINDFFGGDYAGARNGFEYLRERTDYATDARFFLAHTAYLKGDYPTATVIFKEVLSDPELQLADRELAQWNAAINALRQGQDISEQISIDWGKGFPATALERDLASWWRP